MKTYRRYRLDYVLLLLKGIAMGAANKVPGVSGGVVALVGGFYEEFIYTLQKFNRKLVLLLFSKRFKRAYQYVNGDFLAVLLSGFVISYFSISKLLDVLILNFERFVWSAFFGMIIGSIYAVQKDLKLINLKNWGFLIFGVIAGISVSFLEPQAQNDNLWFVFFCGIISVSGMTLPGFSGSFVLILLGNYVLLLVDSVNALFDTIIAVFTGNFGIFNDSETTRLLLVLGIFTLGSIVGLVLFSHLLGYVLKHYKRHTLALILGFITGSLGVVWPWKTTVFKIDSLGNRMSDANGHDIVVSYQRYLPEWSQDTYACIGFIILGIVIVVGLSLYDSKISQRG